jgi:hypothetical protein
LNIVYNERVKLLASTLNKSASLSLIAILAIPILALQSPVHIPVGRHLVAGAVLFVTGIGLHLAARAVLVNLRPRRRLKSSRV